MSVCTTCYQPGLPADGRHDCPGLGEIQVTRQRGRGVVVDHAPQRALIGLHAVWEIGPANLEDVGDTDLINVADQVLYRVVGYTEESAALIVDLVEDWRPADAVRPEPCAAVHPAEPSAHCDKPGGHDGEHSGETSYLYRLDWLAGPAEAPDEKSAVDQQEQSAPVDWQAVANGRERELKLVGEARQLAEAEVDRLRAGEEPGWDPLVAPTPGQWIARFNRASAEERLDVAKRVIDYTATAGECFEMNHVRRLEEDQQAQVVLARVRELRDTWLLTTLEPGQVRRLLDGITRALDGPGRDGIACDAYRPPADPADSGLCAGCGMYDYKHQAPADA